MTRLIESQLDCTPDYNDMVSFLLGIQKFLDDLTLRVEAEAAHQISHEDGGTNTAITAGGDREVILALLGLLSLRRTLGRWLGQEPDATSYFAPVQSDLAKWDKSPLR
jgi:hypothetical protein